MNVLPRSLVNLIEEFSRLPSIGHKTAERLSFYLMKQHENDRLSLAQALTDLAKDVVICKECQNIAETNPCSICSHHDRDKETICVVEEPWDVIAIENAGEYNGLYHVLQGALSPMNNVNPEDLTISALVNRVKSSGDSIKEIIMATNPSLEGEATAMYITKLLTGSNIKITRIARGLPVGSDLEYADHITIGQALTGRREM